MAIRKDLEPIKARAYEYYQHEPTIRPTEMVTALGETVPPVTRLQTKEWIRRWRRESPTKHYKIFSVTIEVALPSPTWEQVVEAVPDRPGLASLVLDGILGMVEKVTAENAELRMIRDELNAKFSNLSKEYNTLWKDRTDLMVQLNHYIAKEKTGEHWTIDESKKLLVPNKEVTR